MRTNQTKDLSGLPSIEPGAKKQTLHNSGLSGLGELPPLPSAPQKKKRLSRFFFRMTVFLILMFILLAAGEFLCRNKYTRDTSLDWLQYHPTRLYINNPNLSGVQLNTEWNVNPLGFRGTAPGLKTKKRILCLGDSRTFGYQVSWDDSYPRKLETMLPDYEVINAGTLYYSSCQGRIQFEEIYESLHPDVVTIAFGYYDRCYIPDFEMSDNPDVFKRFYRFNYFLNYIRYSLLYQTVTDYLSEKSSGNIPPVLSLQPRVNTKDFRKNIQTVLEICARKGIKAILLEIGDNPNGMNYINSGLEALEAQNLESAVQHFQSATGSRFLDERVLGNYYLTMCYQLLGNMDAAEEIQTNYSYQMEYPGVHTIRHQKSYTKVLQNLASEYGVLYISIGVANGEQQMSYIDGIYPDEAGYEVIANSIAQHIQ